MEVVEEEAEDEEEVEASEAEALEAENMVEEVGFRIREAEIMEDMVDLIEWMLDKTSPEMWRKDLTTDSEKEPVWPGTKWKLSMATGAEEAKGKRWMMITGE